MKNSPAVALPAAIFLLIGRTEAGPAPSVSPVYGVSLPEGYRQWPMVAPSLEAEPLNELRVIVGNQIAMAAYRANTLPFPDGAVLAKLAWKRTPSTDIPSATIPGDPTTVQMMVKDSKKFQSSGGWGYGRFIDGKPADEAQHRTCVACHDARVRSSDYVFTHIAS